MQPPKKPQSQKPQPVEKIEYILFDDVNKTISIKTSRAQLVIKFKHEMYFDFVCAIARRQKHNPTFPGNKKSFPKVIDEIRVEINNKLNSLKGQRKKAYSYAGKIVKKATWYRIWGDHFTWRRRRYVIVDRSESSPLNEKQVRSILGDLFLYRGSGENTIFWLGAPTIHLPKSVHLDSTITYPSKSKLGSRELPCVPLIVDVDDGFGPEDITVTVSEKRIPIPIELEQKRQGIFREREMAIAKGEEYPWPGTTYGLEDFSEISRPSITEKPKIHIKLRPTDYFTFKAVQDSLDDYIFGSSPT
jgi:hypothetical protein